jgi:hypothetical protein
LYHYFWQKLSMAPAKSAKPKDIVTGGVLQVSIFHLFD